MKVKLALCAAAAGALLMAPGAALASHGKAGLWQITTSMSGMEAMIPPQARAQMKKSGMSMPDFSHITSQHCMTPQEVAVDTPPPMPKNCHLDNLQHSGGHFSADLSCSGRMNSTGHVDMAYSDAEHYAGSAIMHVTMSGQATTLTNHFEGHWLKADCGSVTH